ncbi:MAG: glycosyltransferase [Chloroflexi bacterium]|nr:glycosyltransferase [Chloroflexota bacterium]
MTRPVIWLAEVPFRGRPHRQPILAERLAPKFEVLFIEPAAPLRPPRPTTWRVGDVRVGQAVPLLNAKPRLFQHLLTAKPLRRLAGTFGGMQVARHARELGFQKNGIVICSNVFLARAIESLAPARVVVDICDDPRFYPGEPPWTEHLLFDCVRRADVVTTTSRALQAEFQQLGAQCVKYVPNGIAAAILQRASAMQEGGSGVVGFLGHLGPWVDFDLLEAVADALPFGTLRLVGSVDEKMRPRLSRLEARQNVQYVGPVPYDRVPDVLLEFDVGLIPFVRSRYTRAVNPIKLYEYAAFNIPIVSSSFSPDVLQFADVIDVREDVGSFAKTVCERLEGYGRQNTRSIAESHTWEAIAQRFEALLDP